MPVEHHVIVRVLMAERNKLFAYIWSIVRNDHITEDVLQDVALLAVSRREEIDGEAHLQAWLRKSARYKALEAVRACERRPVILDDTVLDLLESQWRQVDHVSTTAMTDALHHCMDKLTPHARKIVQMRYRDGVRSSRIAQILNRKVQAIYVTLTRVHRSLGDCIRARLVESDAVVEVHGGDA